MCKIIFPYISMGINSSSFFFSRPNGADYSVQKLVMGTHTSDGAQNYLMIADVRLPLEDTEIDARKYDDESQDMGGFGGVAGKIEVQIRINHEGEVNRARFMPKNELMIATKTISSDVYVFDVSKHPSTPDENSPCAPDYICKGHTKEGYGLCWNPHDSAPHLISGSDDGLICEWNLQNAGKEVEPVSIYKGHTDVIEDVAWHMHHPKIFGSVGDDQNLMMYVSSYLMSHHIIIHSYVITDGT